MAVMEAETTRWLDDEERAAWLPLVRLVQVLPYELDAQMRAEAGISHAYYSMLALLSMAPGTTMSMGELARSTGTTPSRLSHAVDVLEQRGWVLRTRCSSDRRVQHARLSVAGQALLEQTAPGHVARVRELVFDRLDRDQIRALARIASAVLEGIDDAC